MFKKDTSIQLVQLQKSKRKLVFNKVKVYSVCEWSFRRTRDSRGWQGIEKHHRRWKKRLKTRFRGPIKRFSKRSGRLKRVEHVKLALASLCSPWLEWTRKMCQETRSNQMLWWCTCNRTLAGTLCIAMRGVELATRPGARGRLKGSYPPYHRYIRHTKPKTMGNRKKRLCVRLRSEDKHHLRKSDRKAQISSVRWAKRTPSRFVL